MSIFEELGGTYRNENGYLIPNLSVPETKPIGKYGRMRKRYLQEQHPIIFSELLLSGQLYPHLLEIDHACQCYPEFGIILVIPKKVLSRNESGNC